VTSTEAQTVCFLLREGWPGQFDDRKTAAYSAFLLGHDHEAIMAALHRLVAKGARFVPSIGELVGEAAQDPSLPSWDEAWQALQRAMKKSPEAAALAHLEREAHPWVAAFLRMVGWQTLRNTPFWDPDFGPLRLKELREAWVAWVERAESRQRSGLPVEQGAARTALTGPRRLDPLTALRPAPNAIKEES